MTIRIVNDGNSVLDIAPSFDECVIESLVGHADGLSEVIDIKNGKETFRRVRTDEEVSDRIAELASNDAIGSIEIQEHDIIIHLRELGEEGIEVESKS